MVVLKVKSKSESRLRNKHPWAYLDDFEKIPDNATSNNLVEVRDSKGQFISAGYINKNSKIFYRAVSFDTREDLSSGVTFLKSRILSCWKQRCILGYEKSYRICFSENDFLPGLIIDYFTVNKNYQVFVVQILTLGMSKLIPDPYRLFLEVVQGALKLELSKHPWERTMVVLRNDAKIREREGLIVSVPQVLVDCKEVNLSECQIELKHFYLNKVFSLNANLYDGQKTGFFLDQNYNIHRVMELLANKIAYSQKRALAHTQEHSLPTHTQQRKIRILDLCCHLGQWSIYTAMLCQHYGVELETTLVDISEEALRKAQDSVKTMGISYRAYNVNVLGDDYDFEEKYFDLVIVDPPAFVKNKLSLQSGKHAYQKLNHKALKWVADDGFLVSCSCSGLISLEDFKECLQKANAKSFRLTKSVFQGGHAPDHPFLMTFPEGQYLKMLVQLVGSSSI